MRRSRWKWWRKTSVRKWNKKWKCVSPFVLELLARVFMAKSYNEALKKIQVFCAVCGALFSLLATIYFIAGHGMKGLAQIDAIKDIFFISFFLAILFGVVASLCGRIAFDKDVREIYFFRSLGEEIQYVVCSESLHKKLFLHIFSSSSVACIYFTWMGIGLLPVLILSIMVA